MIFKQTLFQKILHDFAPSSCCLHHFIRTIIWKYVCVKWLIQWKWAKHNMDILVFQMWLYFMVLHPQNDDMPIVFEEKKFCLTCLNFDKASVKLWWIKTQNCKITFPRYIFMVIYLLCKSVIVIYNTCRILGEMYQRRLFYHFIFRTF